MIKNWQARDWRDVRILDEITLGDIKTQEDCRALKNEIHESVIWIDEQIRRAKQFRYENGEYEDVEWFQRATTALKFRRFSMQRLQEHLGQLTKTDRKNAGQPRQDALVAALRSHVGDAVFMQIVRQIDGTLDRKEFAS